jgi:hypothetical protein
VLLGIGHALLATYVATTWIFFASLPLRTAEALGILVIVSPGAVLFSSWFVIPIGATLGFALPRVVKTRSIVMAFAIGAALGLIAGSVAAFFTQLFVMYLPTPGLSIGGVNDKLWWEEFWRLSRLLVVKFSIVSALWVGTIAVRLRKRAGLENPA